MIYWDIEANGLLDTVTQVHCIGTFNTDTGGARLYGPSEIDEGLALLRSAPEICGHNIIGFDLPVLQKVCGFTYGGRVWDTLVLTRLTHRNLLSKEAERCAIGVKPGGHRLEDWGIRLGIHKGDYRGGWEAYSEEMGKYCQQDVMVTKALWEHCRPLTTDKAIQLETDFATIISRQERYGCPFHSDKAEKLYADLCVRQTEIRQELTLCFGKGWYKDGGIRVPKVGNKTRGIVKGREFTRIEWVDFNPGSRDHLARCMIANGWRPKVETPGGKPQIDEKTVKTYTGPGCKTIQEYLDVSKSISMVATGDMAWLKKVAADGRLYGRCIPSGAVTGRCTHNNPNLAQIPSDERFRELFHPGWGRVQVGADASGLELRCLAHYMGDDEYTKEVVSGDIHTKNQLAAGLPTRDKAKTFIYAFLYGAGDYKIGSIVGKGRAAGKVLRARFLQQVPALSTLLARVQQAAKRGYLIGLDGSRIPVRSEHAALNSLLQGAGACVMKEAIVILDRRMVSLGYTHGLGYEFTLNVHDEWQASCCSMEVAKVFGEESVKAIQDAGKVFDFRCPLDGAYKIGKSWADTH